MPLSQVFWHRPGDHGGGAAGGDGGGGEGEGGEGGGGDGAMPSRGTISQIELSHGPPQVP